MKAKLTHWILALCGTLASCGSSQQLSLGKNNECWKMESMYGLENPAFAENESFTLRFTEADSTLNGVGACNRFFGKYEQKKNNQLHLRIGGSTMMACPNMNLEQNFLSMLNQVDGFRLENNQLMLTRDGRSIATFITYSQETKIHNAENSLDYEGEYTGTFPAADCPGIKILLTLRKDKSYTMKYDYIDRDSKFTEKGTYTISQNQITLQSGEERQYFKVEENRLIKLDADQKEITGELASMYILQKK